MNDTNRENINISDTLLKEIINQTGNVFFSNDKFY